MAEVDHRVPLFQVRRERQDLAWPDLLTLAAQKPPGRPAAPPHDREVLRRSGRARPPASRGAAPQSASKVCHLTGRNAFTGTPGEALRAADQMATECGAPVVYVRDDT